MLPDSPSLASLEEDEDNMSSSDSARSSSEVDTNDIRSVKAELALESHEQLQSTLPEKQQNQHGSVEPLEPNIHMSGLLDSVDKSEEEEKHLLVSQEENELREQQGEKIPQEKEAEERHDHVANKSDHDVAEISEKKDNLTKLDPFVEKAASTVGSSSSEQEESENQEQGLFLLPTLPPPPPPPPFAPSSPISEGKSEEISRATKLKMRRDQFPPNPPIPMHQQSPNPTLQASPVVTSRVNNGMKTPVWGISPSCSHDGESVVSPRSGGSVQLHHQQQRVVLPRFPSSRGMIVNNCASPQPWSPPLSISSASPTPIQQRKKLPSTADIELKKEPFTGGTPNFTPGVVSYVGGYCPSPLSPSGGAARNEKVISPAREVLRWKDKEKDNQPRHWPTSPTRNESMVQKIMDFEQKSLVASGSVSPSGEVMYVRSPPPMPPLQEGQQNPKSHASLQKRHPINQMGQDMSMQENETNTSQQHENLLQQAELVDRKTLAVVPLPAIPSLEDDEDSSYDNEDSAAPVPSQDTVESSNPKQQLGDVGRVVSPGAVFVVSSSPFANPTPITGSSSQLLSPRDDPKLKQSAEFISVGAKNTNQVGQENFVGKQIESIDSKQCLEKGETVACPGAHQEPGPIYISTSPRCLESVAKEGFKKHLKEESIQNDVASDKSRDNHNVNPKPWLHESERPISPSGQQQPNCHNISTSARCLEPIAQDGLKHHTHQESIQGDKNSEKSGENPYRKNVDTKQWLEGGERVTSTDSQQEPDPVYIATSPRCLESSAKDATTRVDNKAGEIRDESYVSSMDAKKWLKGAQRATTPGVVASHEPGRIGFSTSPGGHTSVGKEGSQVKRLEKGEKTVESKGKDETRDDRQRNSVDPKEWLKGTPRATTPGVVAHSGKGNSESGSSPGHMTVSPRRLGFEGNDATTISANDASTPKIFTSGGNSFDFNARDGGESVVERKSREYQGGGAVGPELSSPRSGKAPLSNRANRPGVESCSISSSDIIRQNQRGPVSPLAEEKLRIYESKGGSTEQNASSVPSGKARLLKKANQPGVVAFHGSSGDSACVSGSQGDQSSSPTAQASRAIFHASAPLTVTTTTSEAGIHADGGRLVSATFRESDIDDDAVAGAVASNSPLYAKDSLKDHQDDYGKGHSVNVKAMIEARNKASQDSGVDTGLNPGFGGDGKSIDSDHSRTTNELQQPSVEALSSSREDSGNDEESIARCKSYSPSSTISAKSPAFDKVATKKTDEDEEEDPERAMVEENSKEKRDDVISREIVPGVSHESSSANTSSKEAALPTAVMVKEPEYEEYSEEEEVIKFEVSGKHTADEECARGSSDSGDDEFVNLEEAVEIDPDFVSSKAKMNRRAKRKLIASGCGIVIVITAIAVGVSAAVTKNVAPSTKSPVAGPLRPICIRDDNGYFDTLKEFSRVADLCTSDTPQFRAYHWIMRGDAAKVPPTDARFLQRYILALIFFSTGGEEWTHCLGTDKTPQLVNGTNATLATGDSVFGAETKAEEEVTVEQNNAMRCVHPCFGSMCEMDRCDTTLGQCNSFRYLSEEDECLWYGNKCTEDGFIRELYFTQNNLKGTIPSEISNLRFLRRLQFPANALTGTIPSAIGKLSQLADFAVRFNDLTGSVPDEMFQLSSLASVDLASNTLTGTISSNWAKLENLQTLSLWNNSFSGSLPESIVNMKNLGVLNLQLCGLTGTIPENIGRLSDLLFLLLDSNLFRGSLPSSIGNLASLDTLRVNNNRLTGTLPDELFNLGAATHVTLHSNEFSGTLSTRIGDMTSLWQLALDNNRFHGTIPAELGNLVNLDYLSLNGNKLNGTMPAPICTLRATSPYFTDLTADCLDDGSVDCAVGCCTVCCDEVTKQCFQQV